MTRALLQGDVHLTELELVVLCWTGDGDTAEEITEIPGITEPTVNFHIRNAQTKLEAANTPATTVKAAMPGLLYRTTCYKPRRDGGRCRVCHAGRLRRSRRRGADAEKATVVIGEPAVREHVVAFGKVLAGNTGNRDFATIEAALTGSTGIDDLTTLFRERCLMTTADRAAEEIAACRALHQHIR